MYNWLVKLGLIYETCVFFVNISLGVRKPFINGQTPIVTKDAAQL